MTAEDRLADTQALMKLIREVFYTSPLTGCTGNLARAIQRYAKGLPRLSPEEERRAYLDSLTTEQRAEYWRTRNAE